MKGSVGSARNAIWVCDTKIRIEAIINACKAWGSISTSRGSSTSPFLVVPFPDTIDVIRLARCGKDARNDVTAEQTRRTSGGDANRKFGI